MKSTTVPLAILFSLICGGIVDARPYPAHSLYKKDSVKAEDPASSQTVINLTATNPNNITDTQILQFALTLENLENAFYSGALEQFAESDFSNAGFPSWVRGRFVQLAQHESTHVAFLKSALGNDSVEPCDYSFPFTDPTSFIALAAALEGVGSAAYLGASPFINSKANLLVAASILATEARHQSWVQSSAQDSNPWSSSFETPLTFNQSFTLASSFITSCPSTNNFSLPVKAFPQLNVTLCNPPGNNDFVNGTSGIQAEVAFAGSETGSGAWLALFHGLQTTFVSLNQSDASSTSTSTTSVTITLPDGLQGTVYAVITSSNSSTADDVTLAGPAILSFPFDDTASNAQ